VSRLLAIAAAIFLSISTVLAADAPMSEEDKQDREKLRALLATFTEAFNSRNLDPLLPQLHPNFTVTMVNQDVVTNPAELKGYLDKQFNGPNALLSDVKIKPAPDIATVFVNGRIGVNHGHSVDTYTLKDGRVFTLNTRWSATMIKEGEAWKVLNAHIGLNAIDNPILDAMDKLRWIWTAAALAAGLAIGFGTAWWLRRR